MGSFSNLLFYLVIQDKAVRESIKLLLQSYDAEVHTYASGRSFLLNTHTVEPGYIVFDDEVDDLNSVDFLSKIKQRNLPNQTILVLNSNYHNYTEKTPAQNSYDAILHKPVNGLKLLRTILALKS